MNLFYSVTGALLTNKQFEPHLNRIMQQHGPSIAKSSYCRRRSKRQNIPFQGQDSWPDNDDTLQRTNRNVRFYRLILSQFLDFLLNIFYVAQFVCDRL